MSSRNSYTGLRSGKHKHSRQSRMRAAPIADTIPRTSGAVVPQTAHLDCCDYQADSYYCSSSEDDESSRCTKRRRKHRRERYSKDEYDWNKCLPPSVYPSTYSIPITGYGYFPTSYYSYQGPLPYVGYPTFTYAAPAYYPQMPCGYGSSTNAIMDTVCSAQGCTTISQPVTTSCGPMGCISAYGPPNIAPISDTVFKRNLFV